MFPKHDENLGCFVRVHEDGPFQSLVLATNAVGETPHILLASSWYATLELALEDLTFVMYVRYSQWRGHQYSGKEEWLESVKADWQMTQVVNSLGGSHVSAEG